MPNLDVRIVGRSVVLCVPDPDSPDLELTPEIADQLGSLLKEAAQVLRVSQVLH